jgi:hypothetical protein
MHEDTKPNWGVQEAAEKAKQGPVTADTPASEAAEPKEERPINPITGKPQRETTEQMPHTDLKTVQADARETGCKGDVLRQARGSAP